MSESAYIYVIGPIVMAVIGGIGWLVKYMLNKRDEKRQHELDQLDKKRKDEIDERNKRRDQIEADIREFKNDIKELKTDIQSMQAIIVGCPHENCPSRQLLADYLKTKKS